MGECWGLVGLGLFRLSILSLNSPIFKIKEKNERMRNNILINILLRKDLRDILKNLRRKVRGT